MLQRDHIMRQIQRFTEVMAQVLLRKQNRQYDEAHAEIQRAGELFLGFDPRAAMRYDYPGLVASLYTGTALDAERGALAAELFRQQGDLFALEDLPDNAAQSHHLALRLYLEVYTRDAYFRSPDTIARIDALLAVVDWHDADPDALDLLAAFYEQTGRFAQAEDVLFALADHAPTDARYAEGSAFFQRLRGKPHDVLATGGLPFHEVGEGLRAFKRKYEVL